MKSNNLSIRVAITAIGAICGAIMLPSISHAVGSVTVNGVQACASSTNMSLNPAGDLVINCNAPVTGGGGGPTQAPVCSVNLSASTITAGQTVNITATCNPAADSYSWTGSPAVSGSGATVSFPTAGTYTYSVRGTNIVGTGPASAGANVVVTPVVTGGGGNGSCVPSGVAGAYTGNSTKLIGIDRGAKVSYSLPIYNSPGRTLEILSIQSTASQADLTSEFSVSSCPGDFDTMQPECKTWGIVNQSGTQLYATTSGSPVNGTCTVILGQQYYINVRNTKFDRVTPACTPQTCYMNVQLNSY